MAVARIPLGFADGALSMFVNDGYFDLVEVAEINGKIEAVYFKRSKVSYNNDEYTRKLLGSLSERWGEFIEIDKGVYRKYSGGILNQIILTTYGQIGISYESKIFANKKYYAELDKDKQIKDEFSKF